jgi:hypothetical protein
MKVPGPKESSKMKTRIFTTAVLTVMAGACSGEGDAAPSNSDVMLAETFVDAFYSFDPDRLALLLSSAGESQLQIVGYQAWAEGGHYEIIERMPCEATEGGVVGCSITVRDDLIAALDLGWWVTDHFEVSIEGGAIVSVETSSNDPQVYHDARAWVQEHRNNLIEGPCDVSPEVGLRLTPGLCAEAMTQGYLDFVASDEFPAELPAAPGV